jgi:protein-disulfide isomerase
MTLSNALRATVASALLMVGVPAQAAETVIDFDNMTPAQTEAFGAAVRDYLLTNPQVIMDAVAVLEQREQEAQAQADLSIVADNADALFNDGYSYVGGNPDGDYTVVEFLDYRCGYCRKAHPEVSELIKQDGNIRLIVKEFPILGEASIITSRFAIATQIVAGDEAYKAVSDALMTLDGNPNEATLKRLATTFGYDADAILAEMASEEITRRIAETRALAQRMQISGTPSFVFGSEMVRGYAPLATMQQIVAQGRSAN